jgi:hypothetical protein
MPTKRQISAVMAHLGRRGGSAGRGQSKRRGDAEHYRRIRAMRRPPQTYERTGEWNSYRIREGRKGWIVDGSSRVQGLRTGWRYLVPYAVLPRETRLDEPINEHMSAGDFLLNHCLNAEGPRRVLRTGHVVR